MLFEDFVLIGYVDSEGPFFLTVFFKTMDIILSDTDAYKMGQIEAMNHSKRKIRDTRKKIRIFDFSSKVEFCVIFKKKYKLETNIVRKTNKYRTLQAQHLNFEF